MFTFLFLRFSSGLNLYYAVQNIASIPQQWLIAQQRLKRAGKSAKEGGQAPPAGPSKKKK
jgi:membrane protein insertase Oxa1/YidC/SpoIIIJ